MISAWGPAIFASVKTIQFFFGLLATGALSAQVFQDDFSDGNFFADPAWSGSAEVFTINANGQLQLQDSQAGQSALFTTYSEASLDNREWRVHVRQSFSGSDNNNGRIYLTALTVPTGADGNGAAGAQGYFLRLGEAGSNDAIHLYRDDNTGDTPALIASGTPGLVSTSFELGFRILRDGSGNWHSAAESQGFATPGYRNSQSVPGVSMGGGFTTDLDVFSPDNDGFEDVVQISYVLDQPGWVATVRIFDQQGREVRLLRQQELLGTKGTFSWDGISDDRQKARMGMYVILVERFLPSGELATDKLTVALAHKLR